ncbi:MAG: LytTR family DNA-binding domain-containing protein [Pseudomonadota bacterium]
MTDELRVLIVDDEQLARRGLELRLGGIDGVTVCGQSRNGRVALEDVARLKPDIVFLDIQMPGMDGFAVLRQLAGADMPAVIFVTAFDKYAVKAFEANALDYLLKPIDDARLTDAIERARVERRSRAATEHRAKLLDLLCDMTGEALTLESALTYDTSSADVARPARLAIRDGQHTVMVDMTDIAWIDAAGDYMCVHANGQTYVLRSTLKNLLDVLDPGRFVRVHRSTIVNRHYVASARPHINGEYFLTLSCGKELKLSRTYKDRIPHLLDAS